MTHPGWIGGFPGDWTYQGDAKLLIKDTIQPIQISLRLIFAEEADIDVVLIWQGITDDDRLKAAIRMQDIKYQVIIIRTSIFLVGYSIPPFNTNNGTTKFNVVRLITYSGLPKKINIGDNSNYFVQLRAYLNDEFSSMDEIFNTEFENTPRQRDKNSKITTAVCGTNWYSNNSGQSSFAIPYLNRVELPVVTALRSLLHSWGQSV